MLGGVSERLPWRDARAMSTTMPRAGRRARGVLVYLATAGLIGCGASEFNLAVTEELPCGDLYDLCGDECLRVDDDPQNCGSCGRACGPDQVCYKGNCTNSCAAGCSSTLQVCFMDFCDCREGLNFCDSRCVDLKTDPDHCGVCGRTCDTGQSCEFGQCVDEDCVEQPEVCGGACTNIDDDILNCGACGRACLSNEVCIASNCEPYFSVSPDQCATCPCEACDFAGRTCCQTEFLDGRVFCAESAGCF